MRRSLTSEVKSERSVPNNSISAIEDEDDGKDLAALITNLKCLHIVRCILERNERVS